MKGMSLKAKVGWVLALAFGFLAFMVVVAAQNPAWGAHGGRVHYYMIAVACSKSLLACISLPIDKFPTYDKCLEHLIDIRTDKVRYEIPGYPVILGKCISWSPPFDNPNWKG